MADLNSRLQHFILVYNHTLDEPCEPRQFGTDATAAISAYLDLEREYRHSKEYEIVLIGSDSLETVRKTHPNYFREGALDWDLFLKELSSNFS